MDELEKIKRKARDEMLSSIEKHGMTESWVLSELEEAIGEAFAAGKTAGLNDRQNNEFRFIAGWDAGMEGAELNKAVEDYFARNPSAK